MREIIGQKLQQELCKALVISEQKYIDEILDSIKRQLKMQETINALTLQVEGGNALQQNSQKPQFTNPLAAKGAQLFAIANQEHDLTVKIEGAKQQS